MGLFDLSSSALGSAGIIGQVGGALTSAIGGYYSAQAQKSNLQFQYDIAALNARIADINAETILFLSGINERRAERGAQSELMNGQQQIGALTLKSGQIKSSQRAALAANGVDLGAGSAAELQASTDLMKEVDRNTLQANAVRSAWGYRDQGMDAQIHGVTQARNARMTAAGLRSEAMIKGASADSISPGMTTLSTLLGSAGKVASAWYQYQRNNP